MKAKRILWVLALAAMGLMMTQNWEFFRLKQALDLNLYYTRVRLPELPVAVLFFFVFVFGLLISSLSFFLDRFAIRRKMYKLNGALESCSKKSAQLEAALAGKIGTDKPRSFLFWRRKSSGADRVSEGMIRRHTDSARCQQAGEQETQPAPLKI